KEALLQLKNRLDEGFVNEQNVWRYVRELILSKPDHLKHTALIDCTRTYSYEQMFSAWESYARVFSALGMTGKNGSRVAIAGTISAEPLFAFYGLNMTGAEVSMFSYPDFLPGGDWVSMARNEKITDLVLSDSLVTPATWGEIENAKKTLGLRNVLLLHSRLGGPCTGPAELVYVECNYQALRHIPQTVFMDDLLRKYAAAPLTLAEDNPDHIALITHTYGSSKGARKALPYTERAVNRTATSLKDGFRGTLGRAHAGRQLRIAPCFDFSSFLCLGGIVNPHLAEGESVVLTFFGFMHPKFVRVVHYYRVDVLFVSGFMIDSWMRRKDIADDAFEPLGILALGGSYLTREQIGQYLSFAKKHGFQGTLTRGYGLAETGGAQLIVPDGSESDILGFPSPKENYRIQDDADGRFYTADDGIRTGILYITSDSMALNVLDGEKLFDYTKIEGREYVCTNDLVRVNEDGSLSYAGRSDRYFANNDGICFDAGLVEAELMKQPGILDCAVVPVLDKRIHDTVPVLYIIPVRKEEAVGDVKMALKEVFLVRNLLEKTAL
ncbi:MAG: AMP-binding protein, partial [bacterium]